MVWMPRLHTDTETSRSLEMRHQRRPAQIRVVLLQGRNTTGLLAHPKKVILQLIRRGHVFRISVVAHAQCVLPNGHFLQRGACFLLALPSWLRRASHIASGPLELGSATGRWKLRCWMCVRGWLFRRSNPYTGLVRLRRVRQVLHRPQPGSPSIQVWGICYPAGCRANNIAMFLGSGLQSQCTRAETYLSLTLTVMVTRAICHVTQATPTSQWEVESRFSDAPFVRLSNYTRRAQRWCT